MQQISQAFFFEQNVKNSRGKKLKDSKTQASNWPKTQRPGTIEPNWVPKLK